MSLAVARQAGFNDEMASKVEDYERSDLPEADKVTLRITDAWLGSPAHISEALRAQALTYFTPEQIVELVLKAWKCSQNKMHASLGMSPAVESAGVTLFEFDESTGRSLIASGDKAGQPLP